MSEYWKSTPKYWCKHCTTFVKDTPFERRQHENTAKHQGNLKRFLRGIQNEHEKNERDKDRTKAELERVNRAVSGNQKAPNPSSSSSSSSFSASASSKTLTAADQKRQWAQLADMGIAVPEHARGDIAIPGEWQVVKKQIEDSEPIVDDKLNIGVRKRKFEGQEEEEAAGHTVVRKGWGSTIRNYPGSATSNDAELDALLETSMFKKRASVKQTSQISDAAEQEAVRKPQPEPDPNVKSEPEADWSQPSATLPEYDAPSNGNGIGQDDQKLAPDDESNASHQPDTDVSAPILFKKRKAKPLR